MIGEGWVNNCGKELFTLGWVVCVVVLKKKDGSGSVRAVEVTGYKLTRKQIDQIKREDEELITLITIVGEYLL